MENIFIQILIAIAGGFGLNLLWGLYEKNVKGKLLTVTGSIHKFFVQNKIAHPLLSKLIRYIICFFIMFSALYLYVDISRAKNKMDKDWVTFEWVVCEDSNLGSNFVSMDYKIYAHAGRNNRQLVVRQLSDDTLVQVFDTDFQLEKPDIYFSKHNLYTLITENKNVNVFNSLNGELTDSFFIQDKKVKAALIMEKEKTLFMVTAVNENSCRIIRYDMAERKMLQERLWENTFLLGETTDLSYYIGLEGNVLFAASLSDFQEEPLYGEQALQICANGVSAITFDPKGKYHFELSFDASTRMNVRECVSNNIIYYMYVYGVLNYFFDQQDHLYLIHQGYVDKIDLLNGNKETIVDLSTIAERKGEKRVGEDYTVVSCCLIQNSRYLAGIVYEPPYDYNRIYIFDMDNGEIAAMSNSVGQAAEKGYIQIVEKDEVLYVTVAGRNGNSIVRYPLMFDRDRSLIFN